MQVALGAEDAESASSDFDQAVEYYTRAIQLLPQDEEQVPFYLSIILEAYWFDNKPLLVVIPLIMRMQISIQRSLEFWENSQLGLTQNPNIQASLAFGRDVANANLPGHTIAKPLKMVCNSPLHCQQIIGRY